MVPFNTLWEPCKHKHWPKNASFLGINSSSSSRVGTVPSAMLVFILHGEAPTMRRIYKHVIDCILDIMGWQILFMARICTGLFWTMQYGTALIVIMYRFFNHSAFECSDGVD